MDMTGGMLTDSALRLSPQGSSAGMQWLAYMIDEVSKTDFKWTKPMQEFLVTLKKVDSEGEELFNRQAKAL
jgi:hypothetical protein